MMIKTAQQAIDTTLKTLTGDGQPISEVFDYYTLNAEMYPYISFELDVIEEVVADSCNNERIMKWNLYLIHEINQVTREVAVKSMYDALESVLNTLGSMTIVGAHKVEVNNAGFGQFQSDKGDILMSPIVLSINYLQGA